MNALAEFTPRLGQVLGIQDLTVDETERSSSVSRISWPFRFLSWSIQAGSFSGPTWVRCPIRAIK